MGAESWIWGIADVFGWLMLLFISLIGVRLLSYWDSFLFHHDRYRPWAEVSARDLRSVRDLPAVVVHISTRGDPDSTPSIRRGIDQIMQLAAEDPKLYSTILSVDVVTESEEQRRLFDAEYRTAVVPVSTIVVPATYTTPGGTQLKARSLHYMVERRRARTDRRIPADRTFILHYDEDSVMEPGELRKLIGFLASTEKRVIEGPIYYSLEYTDANVICRSMEASRPISCFECRAVMERGIPLHLHGSNLVIREDLENDIGWDLGTLDGQPFIAEDYVFGVLAYLKAGPGAFGWHGAAMLEQPPFSVSSAFKQRYRWIVGVLQGLDMLRRRPEYPQLTERDRRRLVWGTGYRVLTLGLGAPTGVVSVAYLLSQTARYFAEGPFMPLPMAAMLWFILVGFMWLGSVVVGAWYNTEHLSEASPSQRWTQVTLAVAAAPVAGLVESSAGLWAILMWAVGRREVTWRPTPKSASADRQVRWEVAE